ncbi:hypothetical protein H1C71_012296 [Ictidomys tridecemlineatus]|nr:hypothetical protein H1C71_012296 [Ictidomys tridecemlineatus]
MPQSALTHEYSRRVRAPPELPAEKNGENQSRTRVPGWTPFQPAIRRDRKDEDLLFPPQILTVDWRSTLSFLKKGESSKLFLCGPKALLVTPPPQDWHRIQGALPPAAPPALFICKLETRSR